MAYFVFSSENMRHSHVKPIFVNWIIMFGLPLAQLLSTILQTVFEHESRSVFYCNFRSTTFLANICAKKVKSWQIVMYLIQILYMTN